MTRARERRLHSLAQTAIGRRLRDLPIDYFRATLSGVERIPNTGGALLVGNHAMGGLDGFVLAALVHRETGRQVRFLGERNLWRIPVVRELLDAAGAVPGTRDRAVALLRAGELCAVYPGGIDDSWKLTATERYKLQWGKRVGFAKVAMSAGVPMVPVAALGIDEMYDVVARERLIGRTIFGSARYDLPVVFGAFGTLFPKRVAQKYLVQPAISTAGDPDDEEAVQRVRAAAYDALDVILSGARTS